jgi:uroporphyrinogen-III synthase
MKAKAHSKPLSGVRILVGRARHQASQLSAGLKVLGAEVIEIPFIEIRPPKSYRAFDSALRSIAQYGWLILTSVNGVDALTTRLQKLHINRSALAHLNIAAIGPATRQRIESIGLDVTVVPKKYVAESVVESLQGKVAGKLVLLARAKFARDVIPRELKKMGASVDVVEAYETVVPRSSRELLREVMANPNRRPHIVTFTSSSMVRNFVALLVGRGRPPQINRCQFASIGPITSCTLRELGLPVHIEAKEYTIPGLIQAIIQAKEETN